MCVAFFNVPPGNKICRGAKPPHERKKPSCLQLTTSACQDQLNTEFSKVCEKFKSSGKKRIFKICPIVLQTCYVLLWRHFHAPKYEAAQNDTGLVALPVSQMLALNGLALQNLGKLLMHYSPSHTLRS